MKERTESMMRESIQQENSCPTAGGERVGQKTGKRPAKTFIALVAACAVAAGVFGFGGTALANRMKAAPAAETAAAVQTAKSTVPSVSRISTLNNVTSTAGDDLTYAEAAAIVKDSVVEINTEYTVRNSWFQYATGGAGSGVILSEDGYIITNAHVILDENMRNPADTVTVRLTDGEEYPAEIKSYDTDEDIALLKIEAKKLTPALIGDSDELVVGEEILVVGNPLGELGGSVSNGIVSATERKIQVGSVMMTLIQTNAAVNPGNSGGGMFNLKGELVGIVNAKSSGTGIEGIGFAIPANRAVSVAESLLHNGYVAGKPMIGVSLEDVSDSGMSGMFDMFFSSGSAQVIIRGLTKGMNDDVLQVGDRIVAVNGEEVTSYVDVKAAVSAAKVGDKLTFTIERDNKMIDVEVTVFERTEEAMAELEEAEEEASVREDDKSGSRGKNGRTPEDPDGRKGDSGEDGQLPDDLYDLFGDYFDFGSPDADDGYGEDGQLPDDLYDLFGDYFDFGSPDSDDGYGEDGQLPDGFSDLFGALANGLADLFGGWQ